MSSKFITKREALSQGLRIIKVKLPPPEKPFKYFSIKQRAVYILHLAYFSAREISKLLGLSKNTVYYYISMAKKEIRKRKRAKKYKILPISRRRNIKYGNKTSHTRRN